MNSICELSGFELAILYNENFEPAALALEKLANTP